MSKTAIIVDSTAYIPQELVEKHNLYVIPLSVNWSGETMKDNVDITAEQFYTRLPQTKDIPTTSQPSAGEFVEIFEEVAKTADSAVVILISNELSGTVASAQAAVSMMDDFPIEVIDSQNTSMALGFLALDAARAAKAGKSQAEIVEMVRDTMGRMSIVFVVGSLEYLHRGGRIGGASRLFGSLLSIKPVLYLANGRVEPLTKVRTKKKAVKHILNMAIEAMAGKSNVRVAVLHASEMAGAEKLKADVIAQMNPIEVVITDISPVIGTHIGPGTLGLVYYAD